jgi:hypothetical protein
METRTSKGYNDAIWRLYQQKKATLYSGLLAEPSASDLKNICLQRAENGLNGADTEVFRTFFSIANNEDLKKGISRWDPEGFKAVINFLINKSQSTNKKNLNFLSVLIYFEPRPLNNFLNGTDGNEESKSHDLEPRSFKNEKEVGEGKEEEKVVSVTGILNGRENKIFGIGRKWLFGIIIISMAILIGIGVNEENYGNKKCMRWQKDHYELIDCNKAADETLGRILPLDTIQFPMKKIIVTAETDFFKDGKPVVWCNKHNNHYDCFDHPGFHPESFKALKPVSPQIAMTLHDQAKLDERVSLNK